MRKGQRVWGQFEPHHTHAHLNGAGGRYVRRDMKRFMPFLVKFDTGEDVWLAACFISETPPLRLIAGGAK